MAEASNQGRSQTRRKPAPWSGVWVHFTRFTDDDGNDNARCKRCPTVLGASTRNGTSTLWKHVRKCWGEEAAAAAAARARRPPLPCASSRSRGPPGREPDLEGNKGTADLARMIALHGYDPSFVEDDYFRSFVRSLSPEFEVPSRVAIEEMCDAIFDEARGDSFSRIRRAPGRVSLAVGKAKTIEAGEAMYIACHFIDDQWNLHKFVLHALVGAEHHYTDSPILGVAVVYDAATHVTHVISDHEDRLSVVAYDITDNDIHPQLKNYIEDITPNTNLSCTTTTYVDNVLHSIARCLLRFPYFIDVSDGMFVEMMDLNLTRQERLQLLSELDLDYEWAYDEQWCACYCSLEVLRKRGFTKLACADLLLQLLGKVWEQVYRGIQRISTSTFPTSNLCLLELFRLREILQPELARVEDHASIDDDEYECFDDNAVDVLRKASDTLEKAIQNSYLVWSVPLALDPRYKLRYIEFSFKRAYGSEAAKYVSDVTTMIKKLYADYIKEYGTITGAEHSDGANAMSATTSADPLEQAWNEHCRSQDVSMVTQVNSCDPETQTELDRYLQDRLAPAKKDFDILNWWKVNSSEYPMVARMARDALAMPTCSKLSSDQIAQVRSILRGYSKNPY